MKFEILFSLYLENPGHEVLMIFVDCRGIFEGSHELFTNQFVGIMLQNMKTHENTKKRPQYQIQTKI